ncbi:hypothetical protein M3Y96_00094300 [Aphelenchoides besseyi]|nr:hypothetical protein M3Y96_00094300 [Aphelenchoides besseyi]
MNYTYLNYLLYLIPLFVSFIEAQDGVYGDSDVVERPNLCNDLYEWQCADGGCIAKYDLCSGIPQCLDESDEMNCPEPVGFVQQDKPTKPQHVEPARKVQIQPKHNTTTKAKTKIAANGWSLRIVAGGFFLLLGLAAVIHLLLKKRRSRMAARNIRRGERSLIGEEDDDLLQSFNYT